MRRKSQLTSEANKKAAHFGWKRGVLLAVLAVAPHSLLATDTILPPATSTGESAEGLIPEAAANIQMPTANSSEELGAESGEWSASLRFVRQEVPNQNPKAPRKAESIRAIANVTGFPILRNEYVQEENGTISSANTLAIGTNNPNFLGGIGPLASLSLVGPGPGAAATRVMHLQFLAGATSADANSARGVMLFRILPKPPFVPGTHSDLGRLTLRVLSDKDGWAKVLIKTSNGSRINLPITHFLGGEEMRGREEQLWASGSRVEVKGSIFGRVKPASINPKLPAFVWYGTSPKGNPNAGFAIFDPKEVTTFQYGIRNPGIPPLVSVSTNGDEVRFMTRISRNFGDPTREISNLETAMPLLIKNLQSASFALPETAVGLTIPPARRVLIERLLGDASRMKGQDAALAVTRLKEKLAAYEQAKSARLAARNPPDRMRAEETSMLVAQDVEESLVQLSEAWASAGGFEATSPKLREASGFTPVPKDDRYSLALPGTNPGTTNWLGQNPSGGKLSVLVLYAAPDYWVQHGRKMVELKRALDLDMEYATCFDSGAVGSRVDQQRIRQLLGSRHWDVILNWNSNPFHGTANNLSKLPPDIRAELFRQVMDEGTGLVSIASETLPEFLNETRKQAADGAATFAGLSLIGRASRQPGPNSTNSPEVLEMNFANSYYSLFRIGKGWALTIDPRIGRAISVANIGGQFSASEFLAWDSFQRLDADLFHAEMARILARAAGRVPAVKFEASPGFRSVEVGQSRGAGGNWIVTAEEPLPNLRATCQIRSLGGTVLNEFEQRIQLKEGRAEVPLVWPELGAGTYVASLLIDSSRGRENFGTAILRVQPAATLTLKLDSELPPGPSPFGKPDPYLLKNSAVPPGEPIKGEVRIEPGLAVPASVRFTLRDDFNRTLTSEVKPFVDGAPVTFSLSTSGIERIPLRVTAEALNSAGSVVAAASQNVALLHTRRDRFQVSLVGSSEDPWWVLTHRDAANTGVTTVSARSRATLSNLGSNFFSGIGTFRGTFRGKEIKAGISLNAGTIYRMDWDEKTGVRTNPMGSWSDPEVFRDLMGMTDEIWREYSTVPSPFTVLYDEGSNLLADTSPMGMKAWQEWLRRDYKNDLAALNREWNSSFPAFEAITETTGQLGKDKPFGDPFEAKAIDAGNFARWADRRVFANQNFANVILDGFTAKAREATQDKDPRIGLSGTFGFHHAGMDYDEWLQSGGFWVPYATPRGAGAAVIDLIRSNKPKGYLYSYWIGYDNSSQLPLIWDMVFRGATGVSWFQMPGDRTLGWFGRNDVPYGVRQKMIDNAILPLRKGLGDLLMRLDPAVDPVAIYQSPRADLVSGSDFIPEGRGPGYGKEFASARNSAAGAVDLVRDTQREFHYLTRTRILAGDLERLGIRVLLLPMIQPLGDDDARALQNFVEKGGLVIADLRPGVMSERGRPVKEGPFDRLFGIRRIGDGRAMKVSFNGTIALSGKSIPLGVEEVMVDADLELAEAKAGAVAEKAPIVMVNPIGKGAFCLLNFGFDRYPAVRQNTAAGGAWRELFESLGAMGSLPPPQAIIRGSTNTNPLCRLNVWKSGGLTLYGTLGGQGSGTITLPKKSWVFDLRRGALGEVDSAKIDLFAADAPQFFATYRSDPGQPVASSQTSEVSGGSLFSTTLGMSGAQKSDSTIFSYSTRLINPKGEWVDVIPWSVQGTTGNAKLEWRVAENDLAGTWRLEIQEVTTGRKTSIPINKL